MKVAVQILIVYLITFSTAESSQKLLSKPRILRDIEKVNQHNHELSGEENLKGTQGPCGIAPDASYTDPWHTILIIDQAYFCEGTLISNEWVLTTAHCIVGGVSAEVILGSCDSSQVILSSNIIVHEDYSSITLSNDIGLVQLSTPVSFTNQIQAICLPSHSDADLAAGDTVLATTSQCSVGGETIQMTVISNGECQAYYGSTITSAWVCCVPNAGVTSGCYGVPLYYVSGGKMYIRGLPSFGSSACQPGVPITSIRVKYYLDWIEENTGIVLAS